MPNPVDHLVYAVPDLAVAVEQFTRRTGVEPRIGGRHVGKGTANYLIGLGPRRYLEIIGPDPDEDGPPLLFGVAGLTEPTLVTWAVRTEDLDLTISESRQAGYDPGPATEMSRQNGDILLSWRLTPAAGLRPFLIDWGRSNHPADADLPGLELLELVVRTSDPGPLLADLAALDVAVRVESADADGLRAVLGTPLGPIEL